MRSLTGAAWTLIDVPSHEVAALQKSVDLSETAARCLAIRAKDADRVSEWLTPSRDHFHDPGAMHGMDVAVDRLHRAVRDAHKVRVVTDYDVDGTTSSLILQAALKSSAGGAPGAQIDYHIPDRFTEGYGFSVGAAQAAVRDGVKLLVTADIGVRDHAAVATAVQGGVDVLICDHHLPAGAEVPSDAIVLCPPQNGCSYPNPHLAACGISLKVADATHQDMRSLVCAQCHAEYYFKKTEWEDKGTKKTAMVVTYPWSKGFSAEKMEEYLKKYQVEKADHVVSSLPLAIIPRETEYSIMRAIAKILSRKGVYTQFQYSLASYRKLRGIFKSVKLNFTPYNIPPAFVFTCRNN